MVVVAYSYVVRIGLYIQPDPGPSDFDWRELIMDSDNIVAEVRRLSETMDRLMIYIEGDKYSTGLLAEMQTIRVDIEEMKNRRARLDQQRKERRSFSWASFFVIPLVAIVEAGLNDVSHAFGINALAANIATVILQILLISLVATTVYVLMH